MAPNGVGEAAVGSSPSEDPNAPFVFTQALFSKLQGAITGLRQEVAGVTGKVTELSQRQATSPYNAASSSSSSDIWEWLDHRQDNKRLFFCLARTASLMGWSNKAFLSQYREYLLHRPNLVLMATWRLVVWVGD